MKKLPVIAIVAGVIIIAVLAVLLAISEISRGSTESDNRVLRSDNTLQAQTIATQVFNFSRFNQVSEHARQANVLVSTESEKKVIEYREILRREKTCDLPVPAHIADGLYRYTNRLRASAMHADSSRTDTANDSAAASGGLTYCQAVLWIDPLLAVIEKGNNNFAGIREIERVRAETQPQK